MDGQFQCRTSDSGNDGPQRWTIYTDIGPFFGASPAEAMNSARAGFQAAFGGANWVPIVRMP